MGIVKAKELIQDADIRSKRYMEKVIEETWFLVYSVNYPTTKVVGLIALMLTRLRFETKPTLSM